MSERLVEKLLLYLSVMSEEVSASRVEAQRYFLEKARETFGRDNASPQPCTSRALKFGVDRILSDDIAPRRRASPIRFTAAAEVEGLQKPPPPPPCSECVSSLLRCCRLGGDTPNYAKPFYPTVLHTPKAIRPYTNLITESDVSERSSLSNSTAKRKRSWSRAVFSNLQRKGLEKRFQIQKYITKPDRRQLAATLGLTDAQVKVWFQNRRMKWRHSKELKFHAGNFSSSDSHVEPYATNSSTFSTVAQERNN